MSRLGPEWPDLEKFCHFDEVKTFGRFYEGLFCIWQNFEPTLQNIRKVMGQISLL